MTETQRRIKAYKAALPGLKERVLAVALLLAMSVAMMTSASFAWLTISRRPEVTGVNTTIAANGNLEIALMNETGSKPQDSKVGDSNANPEQSVANANLTWGNLINLADPSYGLDHLTMRPAQLNKQELLTSPLWGAEYSGDGRIIKLNSDFQYAVWNGAINNFEVSDKYGVRAISSAVYAKDETGANKEAEAIQEGLKQVRENNVAAASAYSALGNNSKYMQSLATMMGLFMTARMNPDEASLNNPDVAVADVQNLRDMYKGFIDCFVLEAEAIAQMANFSMAMQKYDSYKENTYVPEKVYSDIDILGFLVEEVKDEQGNIVSINRKTVESVNKVSKATTDELKNFGVQVGNINKKDQLGTGKPGNSLERFQADYKTIVDGYEKLVELAASGTSLKWNESEISDIVNSLVNVGTCTIGSDNTPINNIGASNAMGYLSGTQEARITNGILYRFEERVGGYIEVKNLGISATVKRMGITVPATVKANIQTSADRNYSIFADDFAVVEEIVAGLDLGELLYQAEDTYGLAVDFWVRTNAEGSYLTLEGNVITEEGEPVPVMGKDADGNDVELYTVELTSTDEEGNSVTLPMDLYRGTDSNGNEVWFNAAGHSIVSDADLNGATPIAKTETPVFIVGYEGENRVWGENTLLTADSTTQGSGSCYVYYAETPEDQARSLKLLQAFNVAFADEEGKLMATAEMDTENFYADNGRVIVPLKLSPSDSINLGEDYEGVETLAITALEKNIPTRVTAIVYLDGTKLTNQDVLSAADIQGQLNIQFGSSQSLKAITNEELESKELSVSAEVDKASFDYDTDTNLTTNVTVRVNGDEPSTVTAFFLRSINATQGSREEEMTFTKNDNGEWVSSYTFKAPGKYVLRTVRLDGVDHTLSNVCEVTVTGFAVETLSCDEATNNHIRVLTAANSHTAHLKLKFATDNPDKMPKKVQGRFLNDADGSAVNVDFTYNPTTQIWSGSATFLTSGDYTMQYLVLDGEYTELESRFWQTADLTLGMRVSVYTTSPHKIKYVPTEMAENEKMLAMQVKIYDNAGGELANLGDAKLTYGLKGSSTKFMDTDLKWDGTYYVGELKNHDGDGGPGVWQFRDVTVGANVLSVATTSPTFTIMSPEPPKYVDHTTSAYQYAPNNDAVMKVRLTNSSTATMQACIVKTGSTQETWVDGENTGNSGDIQVWSFPVPKDANGYQDGNWQMTQLRLWNVFDSDGTEYTKENPLVFDVSDTNNKTKVVSRVYVTFAENKSEDFGKDATGKVTGTFMQEYSVSGISVKIHDFENQKLTGISDVKLTFVYNNNSVAYGGYSSTQLTNTVADFNIALADSGDGITFNQNGSQTLQYAGSYTTTFSFKVNGTEVSYSGDNLPNNAPVFTVSSVKPSVAITGVNPGTTTSIPTRITWTKNWRGALSYTLTENKTNALDATSNTVTVYAKASTSSEAENVGTGDAGFVRPKLTFTAAGIDSSTKITYTIPEGNSNNTINVELTGTAAREYTLGHTAEVYSSWSLATYSVRGYFGHGSQTIDTITVTKNGVEYSVTLDKPIVINNPSSVNKTS